MSDRYAQCDNTCTVDCGHCKGEGRPMPYMLDNSPAEFERVRAIAAQRHREEADRLASGRPADVTREPTGGQELREVLAAVLSDWRARYGRAIPEADEMIVALDRRGVELTRKGHPDCVDAVKFVAEHHHGPDYPHCAAVIADAERVRRVLIEADAAADEITANLPGRSTRNSSHWRQHGYATGLRAATARLRRALDGEPQP